MKPFKKIAVANRGEIAVRIIQTIKEMGMTSVLLHSSEDCNTMAYRLADETLCIGLGEPKDSYLNIDHIIEGIKSSGAEALHPGIGFLSESPDLAQACLQQGIVFIGPTIEQLTLFGSKTKALEYVQSLGVPVLPSTVCDSQNDNDFLIQAKKIGYPLMIKSVYGGGGIGIKKINQESDFLKELKSMRRLSQTAFGSQRVFLEKYLEGGQHIEVQIFGDFLGNIHHLFERNCSIQRRNQKIIEEAPSHLSSELKERLWKTACLIGESIQYQNAGTIEFLVKDDEFYFMEMNTRLQVEHPVTELLLGVDLVRAQILNSMKQIPFLNNHFQPRGHSIECRIYSQEPLSLRPVSGALGTIQWMNTPHSRFDMGYESGDILPSFYDSLIGKVIVWGENRVRATEKMKFILKNSFVFGLTTNISELIQILSSVDFTSNKYNIQFLTQQFKYSPEKLSPEDQNLVQQYVDLYNNNTKTLVKTFNPWFHSWTK